MKDLRAVRHEYITATFEVNATWLPEGIRRVSHLCRCRPTPDTLPHTSLQHISSSISRQQAIRWCLAISDSDI